MAEQEPGSAPGGGKESPVDYGPGSIALPEFRDTRFGRFDRRYTTFTKWLSYLAGMALLSVVIVCVVDTIGWKLPGVHKSIPSTVDFIQYMNVALVFLAVAYVQMDRGSVNIELAQSHFPRWLKMGVRTLGFFLGFASCMYVVYRGYYKLEGMWQTKEAAAGVWKFPLWPFQVCLMTGCFFLSWGFVVTGIRDLIDFKHRRGKYAPSAKKLKKQTMAPPASE